MLAVIDTPTHLDLEATVHSDLMPDLRIEQRPACTARPGRWRMLAHRICTRLLLTPRVERTPASYNDWRQWETPMDRFVRECPSLAIYTIALV